MAKPDHWLYWDAMAPLRTEGSALLAPKVPVSVNDGCAWKKDIPKDEQKLMPKPWAELDIQPTGQNLQSYIFPVGYFEWCLRYLAAAKTFKPRAGASAKAQVLWALDVWTHVVQALAATNINWADAVPRTRALGAGVPIVRRFDEFRYGRGSGIANPQGSFVLDIETARYLESKHRSGQSKKAWDAARLHPAPFMELPQDWSRKSRTLAGQFARYMPWMLGGGEIGSKGKKDSAEMSKAVAASDDPMVAGIFQWRLMCLRDWDTANYWKDRMPLSMGDDALNTRTLGAYIEHVYKYESSSAALKLDYPGLYPNFQFSYQNGLPKLIDLLTTTTRDAWGQALSRYTLSVQEHMLYWVADSMPHLNEARDKARTDVDQPFSCLDFRNLHRRATKDIEDGNARAAAYPYVGVAATKAVVAEAQHLAARAVAIMEKVGKVVGILSGVLLTASVALEAVIAVLGTLVATLNVIGLVFAAYALLIALLYSVLPKAIGAAHLPFYPITNPFMRTLPGAKFRGYSTAPTGSTSDLVLRVVDACLNTELATGMDLGVYDGVRWSPAIAQQIRDRFRALRSGGAVFVLPTVAPKPKAPAPTPTPPKPKAPEVPTHEALPTVVVEGTPGGALLRAFAFTGNPFRLFSRERRT